MNKYIYKVRFVSQEQKLCKILNNKQFNYNFNNRKNDGKKIMKSLKSLNASCLFS